MKLNNIFKKKYLIIIFLIYPFLIYADETQDALTQQFAFGSVLSGLITNTLSAFDSVFSSNMSTALNGLKALFIALIYLHIMYEIAKTYLEGDYKELPIKICTLGFKYISVGTFLGILGGRSYFFEIPSEIMTTILHSPKIDWSNTSPIKTLGDITTGIYKPFDTTAALYVKNQFVDAFKALSHLSTILQGFGYFIIACCALAILVIDYIIITLGVMGILLKMIELTLGLPIIVLLLSGKAIGIGEQYFNISMKYIISAMMDVAIIFAIANIMQSFLNSLAVTNMLEMLMSLFYAVMYFLFLKIAPKIGSGIMSGKPNVTMSDAQEILSIGAVGVAVATGGIGIASGAAKGAMTGLSSGGGISGAAKGAMGGAKEGAKTGVQNFASKANEAMK